MTGVAGRRIHYVEYEQPGRPLLIISPGRLEAAFKHREQAMDFWHQGYHVVAIDHRGQGLSQRFFDHPQLGHMDDFDNAAIDLLTLTKRCNPTGLPVFVLAHSMGASIVLRALQIQPDCFAAAAMTAPMLSLNLPLPSSILKFWLGWKSWRDLSQWRQHKRTPRYATTSRQHYVASPFIDNPLTHSQLRYQWFRELYERQHNLQLGGPTHGWIEQAIVMMQRIQENSDRIETPLLIATAGNDTVVTHSGTERLRRTLSERGMAVNWYQSTFSKHEMLQENDDIRTPLIAAILEHFSRYSDR
nr:alpha/beta fold hydrolase [Echinimonas agarilytica]